MTFFLLLLVSMLGAIQSLLSLLRDRSVDKHPIEKAIAVVLLMTLGATVGAIYLQDKEGTLNTERLGRVDTAVRSIDSAVAQQVDKIRSSLKHTERLIEIGDSANESLQSLNRQRDSLVNQANRINVGLAEQINLDKKKLTERGPIIDLGSDGLGFDSGGTQTPSIYANIKNVGIRTAIVHSTSGHVYLFNSKKEIIRTLLFPRSAKATLPGRASEHDYVIAMRTLGYPNLFSMLANCEFAIISVKVVHSDILQSELITSRLMAVYQPNFGFGLPRDWMMNLATTEDARLGE